MKMTSSSIAEAPDLYDQATDVFLRRRDGSWAAADQAALDSRLADDPAFAGAYYRVLRSWESVGQHATSPELMALREQAIARARQASVRRWSLPGARSGHLGKWAAAAAMLLVCGIIWQISPYGYEPGYYKTGFGEQRTVELSDHSHIVLDARTRLRVRFSADARIVQLLEGQAQFSVAKDTARPFKVEAGGNTIVAVGTVFDVEYVDKRVQIAMVEGRVAVLSREPDSANRERHPSTGSADVELIAGEGMQVRADGVATRMPKADIEAVMAWRQGKVIFHDEPLSQAVRRLNRYSRQQVIVDDPTLAQMKISGVFDSGDAEGFVEALQAYLSVQVTVSRSNIHLQMK